ncbi:carbohydrate-binding protein [Streptomyces yokosukanensis]|uniref:Carbohydrate-binding protein n=1 Tax=Streptomyces yokosukanensis TaxID=67386 RepID=A0A101P9M7_9ACTN|nr:carbohydrate-binding protein [Streptomyces yokosukanensis]KUN07455.1 carbohydrate-binding protein [Streptomyces yokosukanensis]
MTPGDNGASTPEDDDPFGYLYADGQARGAQPPSGGYGYPNSVGRVRPVGERQYGQQPQYGQQTIPQQQGAYGQPSAHYQAPETMPGGAPPSGPRSAPPAPRRGGPNTKGLLIGAIAVVAAVVIGISVAMLNGNDDKKNGNQAGNTPSQSQSQGPSPSGSSSKGSGGLPKVDAVGSSVQLAGGAAMASDVKGAQGAGGKYVGGLSAVGASVTWTVDNIPEEGTYTLLARYDNAGEDQRMTLTVNGAKFGGGFNFANWTHQSDPTQAWTESYAFPTLNKGSNTISLSCQPGDKCNVLLDQLWLKKGKVGRS